MASSTKNIKGNRKVVMVTLHSPEIIFKIPDGLDLEDKNVVEYWGHKWGKMYIKYVGKEEVEEITAYEETEVDYKYEQEIEIIDAEVGVVYSEDEEEEELPHDYYINVYTCKHCGKRGDDDPDCSHCGGKMCVMLSQIKG